MEGAVIYVIIMIVAGIISNSQKKQQKEAQQRRKSNFPNVPTPVAPGTKPVKPVQIPNLQMPGRLPGKSLPGMPIQGSEAPSGAGNPVQKQHPLDLQKALEAQEKKYASDPYAESLREVPESEPMVGESTRLVPDTLESQSFWNNYQGVQRVDPTTEEIKSPKQALLTPNILASGIILSEILQPPRAKRPYHPVYRDREK